MSGITPVGSSINGVSFSQPPTGLTVTLGSSNILTIQPGSSPDSTNETNINLLVAATANPALVGAGGIESAALVASTQYYLHVISSSNNDPLYPTTGLISLSKTNPIMPSGSKYDSFKFIDYLQTDGSANFLKFQNHGNGSLRMKAWDSAIVISVPSSGSATVLTAVPLTGAVPPVNDIPVYFTVSYTPNTANDKVSIAPGVSTATVLPFVSGNVSAKISSGWIRQISNLITGIPNVQYINSATSGLTAIQVNGFEYNV